MTEVNPSIANYQLLVLRNCGQTWSSKALGDSLSPCPKVTFTGIGGTFLRVAPSSKQGERNNGKHIEDFLLLPPDMLRRQEISRLDEVVSITSLNILSFIVEKETGNILGRWKHSSQGSKNIL